jgi:hypothetical protein
VKKLGVVAIVAVGLLSVLEAMALLRLSITTLLEMYGRPRFAAVLAFLLSLLPFMGSLVLGAFLITNRQQLAERWFQDADIGISLDAVSLLRLALIVIGVIWVIDSILSVLKSVAGLIIQAASGRLMAETWGLTTRDLGAFLQDLVVPLIVLGIGALLLARSQPLASYLWVGRKVVVEPEEPALPKCPACGTPFDPAEYKGGMITARCSGCNEPLDLQPFRHQT